MIISWDPFKSEGMDENGTLFHSLTRPDSWDRPMSSFRQAETRSKRSTMTISLRFKTEPQVKKPSPKKKSSKKLSPLDLILLKEKELNDDRERKDPASSIDI